MTYSPCLGVSRRRGIDKRILRATRDTAEGEKIIVQLFCVPISQPRVGALRMNDKISRIFVVILYQRELLTKILIIILIINKTEMRFIIRDRHNLSLVIIFWIL